MIRVHVRDSFPAAHRIRIDDRGTLEPVHVHHWRIEVVIEVHDAPDAVGVGVRRLVTHWVNRHRGRSLNDVPPFDRVNPTAEEVAVELSRRLSTEAPELRFVEVTVGEAKGFSATYVPMPRLVTAR